MSEFFETKKIRDDQEYWDSLAARVARGAVTHGQRENVLVTLAGSWGGWLAATVLAAVAVGIVLISNGDVARGTTTDWNEALQPSDAIGRTITAAEHPPSVGALLLSAVETGRQK